MIRPLCFGNRREFRSEHPICRGCSCRLECQARIDGGQGFFKVRQARRRDFDFVKVKGIDEVFEVGSLP